MEKSRKTFKTRKLTKNEKILLTLLTIVILSWLSYKFIYIPQQEKISSLNSQRLEYDNKIEEINSILRKENDINQEWQDLKSEKEKIVGNYFSTLDQAQIIYILNDIVENDQLTVSDLSFSRPEFVDVGGFQVKSMDISIPYSGKYEGIIDALNSINKSPRKILVDDIYIDRSMNEDLSGSMSLKVYSLEGIAEADKDLIYIDTANNEDKKTPFMAYEDYSIENASEDDLASETSKPYIEEILLDFETNNNYFIPSQKLVRGDVSLSNNSKSKKYSLKLEYNILAIEEENRAFVDVTRNNIVIKYPPNTIGIWVYAYNYSTATLGIAFKGQMGEEVLLPLTQGIGWTGWKHIEATPPNDMNIYPLKLENIYLEISENKEDVGVILLDKLEAIYNRNLGEDGSNFSVSNHIFHVVQSGETIEKISTLYYGTNKYKNEIMSLNEIGPRDIITVGKVLVLKKRFQLPFIYPEIPEKVEEKPVKETIVRKNINLSESETINHIVEKGETIVSISRKHYGTINYMREIMDLNGIGFGDILPIGKVLVLKKH